jgi:hypothetical protein
MLVNEKQGGQVHAEGKAAAPLDSCMEAGLGGMHTAYSRVA